MGLKLSERKAVTREQLAKWPKASKSEKSAILDAVCGVTGWHRDHARKAIRRMLAYEQAGGPPPRKTREPVVRYGPDVIDLLVRCWAALDGPSGKRLHPGLPVVLANMTTHGHLNTVDAATIEQLLQMSASTMDRRLAPFRAGLQTRKGISHTKPGTLLKASIPMKTWHEWSDTTPGFVQIDLVGHEGGDNNGSFFYSLNATDIATGWTETITVKSKGERIVADGLSTLQLRFPFHIHGIHSDNGSEFINHHLFRWCTARQITFTRGRSSQKNDQAHVEQKNWSVVRRNAGYFRYDTPGELAILNEMWPLVSLQVNLFLPQQKLLSKTRNGAMIHKTHDTAATPLHRLITHHEDLLDDTDRARLQRLLADTDLIDMRARIADLQANLIEAARRRGIIQKRAKTNAVYLSRRKLDKRAS